MWKIQNTDIGLIWLNIDHDVINDEDKNTKITQSIFSICLKR